MPFDFSPLTSTHLLLFGSGFAVVYGLLAIGRKYLRPAKPRIYFAGSILVGTTATLAVAAEGITKLTIGLLGVSIICLIVGLADEERPLTPAVQFVWQLIIATIAVTWGWSIQHISQPLGNGVIDLVWGSLGPLTIPGGILTILWLLVIMNAINWFDGSDGVAPGIGVITLLTLAAASLLPSTQDAQTLAFAILGAGCVLGFFLWNVPPARVYLGTTGSWFLGAYIGMVAIIGGGKVITTLLVLTLPVADLVLVIIRRLASGQPPWEGDKTNHLHHRLKNAGVSPRTILIMFMVASLILSILSITLQTKFKIIALGAAFATLLLTSIAMLLQKKNHEQ